MLPITASLTALTLVGLLIYGVVAKKVDSTIDQAVAAGRHPPAPDLSLPVLGSSKHSSLERYHGKVVVLNFWASWCEPCRAEARALTKLQSEIEGQQATVLGVNYRDTEPDALAFEREFHLNYPSLRDYEGKLAPKYGTDALPETFVIDRQGRIVAVQRGQVDLQELHRLTEPALRSR